MTFHSRRFALEALGVTGLAIAGLAGCGRYQNPPAARPTTTRPATQTTAAPVTTTSGTLALKQSGATTGPTIPDDVLHAPAAPPKFKVTAAVDPATLTSLRSTSLLAVERHGNRLRFGVPLAGPASGACAMHVATPTLTNDGSGRWRAEVMIGKTPAEQAELDAFVAANPSGGCGDDGGNPVVIEVNAPGNLVPHATVLTRGPEGHDEAHDVDNGNDLGDDNIER
jgi:hypothetical protein